MSDPSSKLKGIGVELHQEPGAPEVLHIGLSSWVKYLFIGVCLALVIVVGGLYYQYREMQLVREVRAELIRRNERLLRDFQNLTLQQQTRETQVSGLERELELVKRSLNEAQKESPMISANLFSPQPPGQDAMRLLETMANLFPTLPAYRSGSYVVLQLPGASFDLGSAEMPTSLLEQLAIISKVFETYSGEYYLAVEGHTDATPGSTRSNWEIGSKRAERVLEQLIRLGVPPGKLALVSRAEYLPINPNAAAADPENRRVELVFAPGRMVKKGQGVAALLSEEQKRAMLESSREAQAPVREKP